ncbi:hypothetical protein [Enterovirga rhinocerotis]|uniref:hypothetical protein n=1 Tax=Enterovirga rhinocerotis TaxID=1339210 RepID=UPI00105F7803|nr:hypothetical protein [Enterovirga rhinocerotis]
MLPLRSLVLLSVGFAVTGCVQQDHAGRWARMAPAERQAALDRVTVSPAGISTVQFKEMGDTARARVLNGLIRKAWRDTCNVAIIIPAGYYADGHSRWRARCGSVSAAFGYTIALPEKPGGNARLWQCNRRGGNSITCSVFDAPAGAGG